jgi:hypothetical protein
MPPELQSSCVNVAAVLLIVALFISALSAAVGRQR